MAGFLARFKAAPGAAKEKALLADLTRITNSSNLVVANDVPAEALEAIIQASHCEEGRQTIMKHLRECLAETSGKQWRRPFSSLILVEALLKNGSSELVAETAEGRHFDLVQRLSFLEQSAFDDKRVQGMIRLKAESLRKEAVTLIQNVDLKDREMAQDPKLETASTCSPDSVPSSSGASESSASNDVSSKQPGFGADDGPSKMLGFGADDVSNDMFNSVIGKRTVLNNIVSVGHCDDTTSESECGEGRQNSPVRSRESKKMSARERNERSHHAKNLSADVAPVATQEVAQSVDLLDF